MDVIATAPAVGSSITVAGIRPTKATDTKTKATATTKINIKALANQKSRVLRLFFIYSSMQPMVQIPNKLLCIPIRRIDLEKLAEHMLGHR